MQAFYPLKIQAIRSKGQQARLYVYFPLPLAAAIGLQAGEEVQWELLDRGEFGALTAHVALIAAVSADREGNLYTGPNTEDTSTIVEATHFKSGIVVAQVNKVVERVPRVDIPGDRVDLVVEAPNPFYVEPLFTRDPAEITETQILMAMLAIKGIYAEYGIRRLNHGIGF